MEDQLDEDLKNRIKKVFDEYEDPSAEEGWQRLRKKFPAGNNRRILPLLWWSAAALLLLTLGLGIWKYAADNQTENEAVIKKVKPAQPGNMLAAKPAPLKTDQTPSKSAGASSTKASAGQASYAIAKTRVVTPFTPPAVVNHPATNGDTTGKPANQAIATVGLKSTGTAVINQAPNKNGDTSRHALTRTPQNQLAVNKPAIKKVSDLGPRVRLGVYAASFVSYAKGSTNQTNGGAGFSAEIRIAKNLKIVTGLMLAKNSLSYAGGVPSGAAQSNLLPPHTPKTPMRLPRRPH